MKNLKLFLLIISLIFLVSILLSCNPQTSDKQSPPETITKADIEIVNWTNYLSDSKNYYYIDGILKNVGNEKASYVKVKIKSFDINDNLISIDEWYADPFDIFPDQEATFSAMVSYSSKIYKFKLSVLWE